MLSPQCVRIIESKSWKISCFLNKVPGKSPKTYHDSDPCSKTYQLLEFFILNILSLFDLLWLLIIQLILLIPHSLFYLSCLFSRNNLSFSDYCFIFLRIISTGALIYIPSWLPLVPPSFSSHLRQNLDKKRTL